jgi:membrane-bound metal-dependent hydrolase YbcI (DUF457 family)
MIAAMAARLNLRHQVKIIFSLAVLTVLIDLDHLSLLYERALLHNVFITLLIPIVLILLSFHFRLDRYKKGAFLLLLIFLSSHIMLDLFEVWNSHGIGIKQGDPKIGVALFYPLSSTRYSIDVNIPTPGILPIDGDTFIVTSAGVGILLYFAIIVIPCLFLDDIIEISEKHHERLRKATKEFFANAFN